MSNGVMGLDLSSTSTGACLPSGGTVACVPSDKLPMRRRCRYIADAVSGIVDRNDPALVVIEAIGTNRIQAAISAATVHAYVLDVLAGHVPVLFVTPSQLKKFALGKGAGKGTGKTMVTLAASQNGWVGPSDLAATTNCVDDEADAWWLWAIGCHWRGAHQVTDTAYRQEVVSKLSEPTTEF